MITIGKPYVSVDGNRAYLRASVKVSDDTAKKYVEETDKLINTSWLTAVDYPPAAWKNDNSGLWFSVPSDYQQYLCPERSNAFVVAMLWYAMLTGSDIRFEAPVSKQLYDGLTGTLIPALAKGSFRAIRLEGEVTSERVETQGGVVSGLSCGADSFYTLHCYGGEDAPVGKKLTHLSYYMADYLFPFVKPPYDVDVLIDEQEKLYNEHVLEYAGMIAEHHKLPFLVVRTNLDRDYYRGGLIFTGMYRFLACTLALEHLFSLYLISSSGNADNVGEPSISSPTQSYEDLICSCCGTESLNYQLSDHVSRVKKLEAIADDPDVRQYLSVCYNSAAGGVNCGKCFGCWKTLIPLDFLGKLDGFSRVFNLKSYYGNRRHVFEQLVHYSFRPEAAAARDINRQLMSLAETVTSDSAKEFIEVYTEFQNRNTV